MTTTLHRSLRRFAAVIAGILLLSTGDKCFAQAFERAPNDIGTIYKTLMQDDSNSISASSGIIGSRREEVQMLPPEASRIQPHAGFSRRDPAPQQKNARPNPVSPTTYFRTQLSEQIDFLAKQGNDVRQLREMVERLLHTLEANMPAARRDVDVDVAVFEVPTQSSGQPVDAMPDGVVHLADSNVPLHNAPSPHFRRIQSGRSGFGPMAFAPPGLLHGSPGGNPQDEDRQQPEALKEAAERLEHAGLSEIAHNLRELAGHIEREAKEKHERMRQSSESPNSLGPAIHELHEQVGQLRRDMHKLSEQMEHLTDLIQIRHKQGKRRHHREDMDDQDEDHKDRDDEDDDHDRKDNDDNDDD